MEKTTNNETNENVKKVKKPVAKGNISGKDADVYKQGKDANSTWKLNPDLTLRWITQSDFEKLLNESIDNFDKRLEAGSNRPAITSNLKTADKGIDNAVAVVKTYFIKKYENEKAAIPYYASFGLVHNKNKSYTLPKDREKRLAALPLMLKAIKDEGFGNEKYGTTFWTDTIAQYKELTDTASATAGSVSTKVGNKNQQIAQIKKVLNALINLVKANFPDTYQSELRNWGVQKEKF
jgi:hypothetical protein